MSTRSNLVQWTGQAGDSVGVRDQLAALLPIRERVLGLNIQTLSGAGTTSPMDRAGGDAAGARGQLAILLGLWERVLGPEHPDTLITRHALAQSTGQAGDMAGAREQLAALLPTIERVLGADHPSNAGVRLDLSQWEQE